MVVEPYLRVEKAKIKPQNNNKAKQKSSRPNSPEKAKKVPKFQTKNVKAKHRQKWPNGNPGFRALLRYCMVLLTTR